MTRALLVAISLALALPAHAASHIRGFVSDESGAPLPGATVTALYGWEMPPGPPNGGREPQTTTGPDGRYDLELDDPGCYLIRAAAAGHQARFYPDVPNSWEATCVEAGPAPVEGIDLNLPLAGAIAGRITDARSGEPVAGATVAAWPAFVDSTGGGTIPPDGGDPGQGGGGTGHSGPGQGAGPDGWDGWATTDSTGSYRIDGLASGDFLVHAEAEGHIAEFYPDTQDPEAAVRIAVTIGNTASGIDLALGRGGCIHGRVTDERTGTPIAGAFVTLGGIWMPPLPPGGGPPNGGVVYPEPGFGATTDADGRYDLCGLPPGAYPVFAAARGYLGEFFPDAPCLEDADLVAVQEDGDVNGIDFALGEGGRILGRVLDGATPVGGVHVLAWVATAGDSTVPPWPGGPGQGDPGGPSGPGGPGGPDGPWNCAGGFGADATTDSLGDYVLTGLASGSYLVMAEAPDFLPTFHGGGQDPQTAVPVAVTAPNATTGIDIVLERGGAISGAVRDEATGAPLAGIGVEIYLPIDGGPGPRPYLAATTDPNGAYRITGIPRGEYRVLASDWNQGYELEFYREAASPEAATPIAVVPPAEVTGIDFTLTRTRPDGGAIGGMVAGEDGQPIPGAVVTAISLAGHAGIGVADSAGVYWIASLPADDYVVLAAGAGRVGLFYQQALSWEDATPVRVDGPVTGIDFTLAAIGHGPGVISGRVTDAGGVALAQASVYAEPETDAAPHGFALSARDGSYTIVGLIPGRYRIRATRPGMADAYAASEPGGSATWITVANAPVTGVVVVLGAPAPSPAGLRAEPSVPNPFHDTVAIRLLSDRAHVPIGVDLYAVSGRLVRRLELTSENPGRQEITWDGRDRDGVLLPSGVYVYRASLGGKTVSGRLVLVR
jgi:hypothetical protein